MKKIIRLTESDLRGIVQRSVLRVLQEQNDFGLLLQSIAQSIAQKGTIYVNLGENYIDVELQQGNFADINFEVDGDPYLQQGMKSSSYDVPNDPDEIIDNLKITIGSIEYCNGEGECFPIRDNGIVKKALESVIQVDYSNYDVPSEEDYFYYED